MLFDLSINEDYYKPIRSKSALNGYIEHESKGDKDKILSIRKYLEMIRPYLCDIKMITKLKENGMFIQVIQ